MSQNLEKIFYINLDKRTDRREEIENELKQFNLYDKTERFPAIHNPNQGILGCTMSHLAVFKLAKERNYEQVLILEDDFYFIVSQSEFENTLTEFFDAKIPYDVCMISYHIQQSEPTEYPFIHKVIEAQTASGYIVHKSFYDTLINLYEDAVPKLRDTNHHWLYANDQVWKQIQPTAKWYALTTRCGRQRDGFSDNSNRYQTYDGW
jgi:glycosyl transferase family 25